MLKSFLSILFVFSTFVSFGQLTLQQKLQSNLKLEDQFQVLLLQSKSQDVDFKIIRKTNIDIIKKNVSDSISKYTKEIASLKANSSSSVTTVQSLRDSVNVLSTDLATEKAKTDSISFLGVDFGKGTYHTIVWSIIIVLALLFIVILASFRKAKVDANEHQKTAEQVQNEFQTYKKKALETEQKLKRQLLDEELKRNS